MVAGENRVAPELHEKEAIELLEDLSNVLGVFFCKTIIPPDSCLHQVVVTVQTHKQLFSVIRYILLPLFLHN